MCVSDLHADISDSLYLDDTAKTEHDEGTGERLDGVRVYGSSDSYVRLISASSSFGNKMLYLSLQAGGNKPCRANLAATLLILLPPTKEEVRVFSRVHLSVCLSVCLLARLLKNACMDLDVSTDVGTWTN